MTASPLDSTTAAELFLAGARDAGLSHVVVSPGSRSTPLAIAVDRTRNLSYSIHLDERTAAFVALGRAKATGQPVGLICTSGTAAANYLPAVAEASMSSVPLVVITADRPPEHQRWGVGQSFDQRGLYRRQVRDEITMPVGGDGGEAFSHRAGWRATSTAICDTGPVHVNWPFRMPLEPTAPAIAARPPLPRVEPTTPVADPIDVQRLRALLDLADHPVIVAGPDAIPRGDRSRFLTAARTLGLPVLADVLSGVRGLHTNDVLVPAPSLVTEVASLSCDMVIRIGNTPTAKSTRLWWETLPGPHVLLDPRDEWQDPSHRLTERFRSPPTELLEALAAVAEPARTAHLDDWLAAGSAVRGAVDAVLDGEPAVSEAHIGRSISRVLSALDLVYASSSMPVRDLDTFGSVSDSPRVMANRGINGIDGVIASAIGASHAMSGRTVVHIGDVAVLHDIGSLLDAARRGIELTIVIPNNDGGGIFSMLPIRSALDDALFSSLFHTPHGTTFEFLAEHAGVTHRHTTNVEQSLAATAGMPGLHIIEVAVGTPQRIDLQRAVVAAAASVL